METDSVMRMRTKTGPRSSAHSVGMYRVNCKVQRANQCWPRPPEGFSAEECEQAADSAVEQYIGQMVAPRRQLV